MRSPDLETAVELYYTKTEIGTEEVKKLFDCCASFACKMKKPVLEEMAKQGVRTWRANAVNVKLAYSVWGIDIADYEARLKKLKSLKIT